MRAPERESRAASFPAERYIDLPQANFGVRTHKRSFPDRPPITLGNSIINLRTFRGIPLTTAADASEVVSRERPRAVPRQPRHVRAFRGHYFTRRIYILITGTLWYQRYFGL